MGSGRGPSLAKSGGLRPGDGVPDALVVSPLGANGSVFGPVSALAGGAGRGAAGAWAAASAFSGGGALAGDPAAFEEAGAPRTVLPQEGQTTSLKSWSSVRGTDWPQGHLTLGLRSSIGLIQRVRELYSMYARADNCFRPLPAPGDPYAIRLGTGPRFAARPGPDRA